MLNQPRLPRIGSLCSGYGGLDLGLMAVIGGSVAWHVEYDKHPSAVLEARFPGVPNYGDVTTTDWTAVEPVDWLTAGYPCQPFSHAGKRRGSKDERHLWPAVRDAIGVLRPCNVLLENVAGHVSLGLDAVLADLAALGYDSRWGVVRASDAGAPHRRERIFVVAADAGGDERGERPGLTGVVAGAEGARARQGSEWQRDRDTAGHCGTAATDTRGGPRQSQRPRTEPSERGAAVADPGGEGLEGLGPERGDSTAQEPTDRGSTAHADAERRERRWEPRHRLTGPADNDVESALDWGAYEPAIRRWEHVLRRPAPRPTVPRRNGERLNPHFVEWMQGLPDGWVADILPRNPALKCLGNGVVPQQAALAVSVLRHNRAEAVA